MSLNCMARKVYKRIDLVLSCVDETFERETRRAFLVSILSLILSFFYTALRLSSQAADRSPNA